MGQGGQKLGSEPLHSVQKFSSLCDEAASEIEANQTSVLSHLLPRLPLLRRKLNSSQVVGPTSFSRLLSIIQSSQQIPTPFPLPP